MTQESDDVVEVDVQVAGVIEAVARELENQHLFLKQLERKISDEISNYSFSESNSVSLLQNIDRLIQEVEDLSRLMSVLAENISNKMSSKILIDSLQDSMKLNSLKNRLFFTNNNNNCEIIESIEIFK